jgi:DNA adenine methylase
MNNTPLRYPGGKSLMTPFFQDILRNNNIQRGTYAEPYAGGAGAAINLLLEGSVDDILINDASIGIFSFWSSIVENGNKFIKHIQSTEVTLQEWQKQRAVFKTATKTSFELGFATFFLTRTNRSGILSAGPIGGQNKENQKKATYKIDCRFNKDELIKRIRAILKFKDRITVSNLDALDFLKTIRRKNSLVYLDPPYFKQGQSLYLDYYTKKDHELLSIFLAQKQKFKWLLSYDNTPEIRGLYSDFELYNFDLCYTANSIKKGSELLTCSKDLRLPESMLIGRTRSADIKLEFIRQSFTQAKIR